MIAGVNEGRADPISITLSPAQVEAVVRAASRSGSPSIAILISGSLASSSSGRAPRPAGGETADPRLSRSLLRGLSMLTRFGPGTRERGIVELAAELDMSPSTAHRYAQTLVQLGLLARCPTSRKYRLPAP
jgi:hypothetical protein